MPLLRRVRVPAARLRLTKTLMIMTPSSDGSLLTVSGRAVVRRVGTALYLQAAAASSETLSLGSASVPFGCRYDRGHHAHHELRHGLTKTQSVAGNMGYPATTSTAATACTSSPRPSARRAQRVVLPCRELHGRQQLRPRRRGFTARDDRLNFEFTAPGDTMVNTSITNSHDDLYMISVKQGAVFWLARRREWQFYEWACRKGLYAGLPHPDATAPSWICPTRSSRRRTTWRHALLNDNICVTTEVNVDFSKDGETEYTLDLNGPADGHVTTPSNARSRATDPRPAGAAVVLVLRSQSVRQLRGLEQVRHGDDTRRHGP